MKGEIRIARHLLDADRSGGASLDAGGASGSHSSVDDSHGSVNSSASDESSADEVEVVPGGLLGELDLQQDDVIRRLDELNAQIECLMLAWTRESALLSDESEAA